MENNVKKSSLLQKVKAKREEYSSLYYPKKVIFRPESKLDIDKKHFESLPNLDNWIDTFKKHDLRKIEVITEPEVEFSKSEALDIAYAYYTSTNARISEVFKSLFDKRDENLTFVSNNKHFDSGTTYLEDTGSVLMSVNYDGSISGLTSLIHEYAHAIGFITNPVEYRTGAENSFIEIESYLHSILFLDFLDQKGFEKETVFERNKILNTAIESTDTIRKKKFILMIYEKLKEANPDMSFKEFCSYLRKEYDISKKEYGKTMAIPADIVSPYVIGPYVAFELYDLYQTNPEYALFLFSAYTHIYAPDPEDFFNQIENGGLTPGEHVDTFTRKIKMR